MQPLGAHSLTTGMLGTHMMMLFVVLGSVLSCVLPLPCIRIPMASSWECRSRLDGGLGGGADSDDSDLEGLSICWCT